MHKQTAHNHTAGDEQVCLAHLSAYVPTEKVPLKIHANPFKKPYHLLLFLELSFVTSCSSSIKNQERCMEVLLLPAAYMISCTRLLQKLAKKWEMMMQNADAHDLRETWARSQQNLPLLLPSRNTKLRKEIFGMYVQADNEQVMCEPQIFYIFAHVVLI